MGKPVAGAIEAASQPPIEISQETEEKDTVQTSTE
jgi:hypothetical protein